MPQLESFAAEALSVFSADLVQAIESAELPSLGDGPHDQTVALMLARKDFCDHLGVVPASRRGECCSGLWLLAGDLDRSHSLSQEIENAEGSFWHGIMHRREGDFSNAKYWFRRVGKHPVFDQIAGLAPATYRDPFEFVDACSRVTRSGEQANADRKAPNHSDEFSACQWTQWLEWQSLMAACVCG